MRRIGLMLASAALATGAGLSLAGPASAAPAAPQSVSSSAHNYRCSYQHRHWWYHQRHCGYWNGGYYDNSYYGPGYYYGGLVNVNLGIGINL